MSGRVGLPEDFRYSYWTVLVGVVSNAITLGFVVLIAGRGDLREMLALRRPKSWRRAALIGVLVIVGTGLLLVLFPFLQTSEEQGLEVDWDPDRAVPFALNAAIIVLVSPIVEELTVSRSGLHAVGALRPGMGDRADRSRLCALPWPPVAADLHRSLRLWSGVSAQPHAQRLSRHRHPRAGQPRVVVAVAVRA